MFNQKRSSEGLTASARFLAAITGASLVIAGVTVGATGMGAVLGVPLATSGATLVTRSLI